MRVTLVFFSTPLASISDACAIQVQRAARRSGRARGAAAAGGVLATRLLAAPGLGSGAAEGAAEEVGAAHGRAQAGASGGQEARRGGRPSTGGGAGGAQGQPTGEGAEVPSGVGPARWRRRLK